MRSQPRTRLVVTGLALGLSVLVATACGEPPDEVGGDAPTTASSGLGGMLAPPEQTAKLDPQTKQACESLWGFNTYAYSARVTPAMAPGEVERHTKGLDEYEPRAGLAVPTLRNDIQALGKHARAVISSGGARELTPDLAAANGRVVDYLRTTCKYKMAQSQSQK